MSHKRAMRSFVRVKDEVMGGVIASPGFDRRYRAMWAWYFSNGMHSLATPIFALERNAAEPHDFRTWLGIV